MNTKMTRIKPAQEPQTPNMARKGEFPNRVGLNSPCISETDVAKADGALGEERRETAKREKLIEDEGPTRGAVDVCQRPKEEDEDEWTA